MRFYTRQHRHYCGVDLHARSMYVCVLDRDGNVLVSKNIASAPEPFLELIAPYREDLVLASLCRALSRSYAGSALVFFSKARNSYPMVSAGGRIG
jgi:predicted NBD/HSP70 family sugar kinase